ncbi:MAG: non-hydrolyzing UDP-N-acetylglucosamine 2-epimerase [Acidimicrobiales bacterium]
MTTTPHHPTAHRSLSAIGGTARPSTSDRAGRSPKMIVPVVIGTRPEAIKMVPVIMALRDSDHYEPLVVSTGQHNRMVNYIFDLVGIVPDVMLWSGSRQSNLNARVASIMERFADFCAERFGLTGERTPTSDEILEGRVPAAVLVHGDTSSAMAAAMSSFHLRIPVMHVEAGLRTGTTNSPFPEELNRQVISRIASLHFAPTPANLQHLVREGVSVDQIFVTGNTGIDALRWAAEADVRFANPRLQELYESDRRVVVVTAHRRENWGRGLAGIAEGVARLAASAPDVQIVLPLHPNPEVREQLEPRLAGLDNVILNDPLGYATFSKLLGRAHLVMTDSGGVQEEAPSLDVPVLVLRDSTERTEGVAAGTLRLVGTDPDRIHAEAMRLLDDPIAYADMAHAPNPYGDGRAAERIVAALEHALLGEAAPAPFGPGYDAGTVSRIAGLHLNGMRQLHALRTNRDDTLLPDTVAGAVAGIAGA